MGYTTYQLVQDFFHQQYGYGKCRYYYGINELFQRHPDLVEILSRTAPVSLGQICWLVFVQGVAFYVVM